MTARYHIPPYRGGFIEPRTHRIGMEAEQPRPVVQHLGEKLVDYLLPQSDTLLNLPSLPVLVLNFHKATEGGILLILYKAGGANQKSVISSGIIHL